MKSNFIKYVFTHTSKYYLHAKLKSQEMHIYKVKAKSTIPSGVFPTHIKSC